MRYWALVAVFIVTYGLLDILSTIYGIESAFEANSIARGLYSLFGVVGLLILKLLGIVFILSLCQIFLIFNLPASRNFLLAVYSVMGCIISANNFVRFIDYYYFKILVAVSFSFFASFVFLEYVKVKTQKF